MFLQTVLGLPDVGPRALVCCGVGKGLGKIMQKNLLGLSGSYSLGHKKDLRSERSSALDPPSINISATDH